jgi:hypothetical protein
VNKFLIREFSSSDIDKIVSLHQVYFGDSRTKEVFEWEYSTLTDPSAVLSVLEVEDNVVGTHGFIPIKIIVKNSRLVSSKAESSIIDKKYRREDLFEKLYLHGEKIAMERGIKMFWGITTIPDLFCSLFDYKKFEDIHNYVLFFNYRHAVSNIIKSIRTKSKILRLAYSGSIFVLSALLFTWIKLSFFFSRKINNAHISEDLPTDPEITALYDKLKRRSGDFIQIHLSNEFLQWRFFNRPYINCKAYFIYRENELFGYVIFSITKSRVVIEDILFLENKAGYHLIIALLKYAINAGIGFVSYYANSRNVINKMVISLLRKFGFLQISKKGIAFIYKDNSDLNLNSFLAPENWYITHTWSEGN